MNHYPYLLQAVNSNCAFCYYDSSSDKHTTSAPEPFVAGAVALGASPLNPRLAVSHASSDNDGCPTAVMEGAAVFEPGGAATCKAGFGAGGTRCAW